MWSGSTLVFSAKHSSEVASRQAAGEPDHWSAPCAPGKKPFIKCRPGINPRPVKRRRVAGVCTNPFSRSRTKNSFALITANKDEMENMILCSERSALLTSMTTKAKASGCGGAEFIEEKKIPGKLFMRRACQQLWTITALKNRVISFLISTFPQSLHLIWMQ